MHAFDAGSPFNTALIVFARPPVYGQVKTRLAASLGDDRALAVYQQLLMHTFQLLEKWPGKRYLFHAAEEIPSPYWPDIDLTHRLQSGKDLGQRMQMAFEEVLAEHSQALIIGTDCPGLQVFHLQEAARQLARYDLVLGPAADGGYYLLGLKQSAPSLFTGMPWSTDRVAALTLNRAEALNWRCHELPVLRDVDTEQDLGEWLH